ncbi:MAG: hypothetical protein PHX27_00460 [Candidatus ainarchaeum sp.]|nr:hypothetical protein [Candidatus ainarchaeum sp.]
MIKGQIFSIDFLLAMVLCITFFGLLLNTFEIKNNTNNETIQFDTLSQKANSSFIALTNNKYACKLGDTTLAFTLNETMLTDINQLKKDIGLINNKIKLTIGNEVKFNEINSNQQEIIVIENEIFTCTEEITFNDLNNCLAGNACRYPKKNIKLMVSK